MAQASWPSPAHNSRAVTDPEYELLASRHSDDGVYGDPTDPPVATAGTGLSVNIRADAAASIRGHGWYSGSSTTTVPLAANPSGQTRIDWIVLRLDRSTWTVRAAAVTGTPGAGAPALTQATGDTGLYEIPLAQARILAGASTATVTRAELYVGTRCRPCTSTTRTLHPRLGEEAFETDTRRRLMWDGTGWRVLWEEGEESILETAAVPGWTVDSGTVLRVRQGVVFLRLGAFGRTSALAATTESRLPIVLPAHARPPVHWQFGLVYITGLRIGRIVIYDRGHARAGQVWLGQHPDMTSNDSVVSTSLTWAV